MSLRRAMGIETEYGISVPGRPHANPMVLSGHLVQAYARSGHPGREPLRVRWDYAGEAPLQDARGFALERHQAHETQLTNEWADDPLVANVVLTNGARLYVDHAHPEYSSPEVLTAREALVWDRAGEEVMAAAAHVLAADGSSPDREGAPNLYKNNTDGKGASYGTHENYLVRRDTPFGSIVAGLLPFFVVRQILCGAGRVGLGQSSERPGYQIASRSDFFEAEVGLETTFRRPLINTRDEPHASAEKYRRLHVILGDANLCDVAGLLKVGTTSLVLGAIEDGAVPDDLAVREPVATLRAVSHDPTLTRTVELLDGTRLTGLDLLWRYFELVRVWLDRRAGDSDSDADTVQVMTLWEDVLTRLGRNPSTCAAEIDWVAKLALLQGYRDRDSLGWGDPRLRAVDIQWSDVRPQKGLARRLEARGRLTRLTTPEEVSAAVHTPPESTRAWCRGECVRRYRPQVVAASWESVVFDVPGHGALQWVGTPEPLRGSRVLTQELLDRSPDAQTLLRELTAQ